MARRMLDSIDGRRASLFDERFRISMIDVTSSSSVYGAAVEAAARAGRPREAMEFMERGKARSLQDRYASDREPAQRRLNDLAQVVELLENIDSGAGSGTNDPGRTRMAAELARRRVEYGAALRAAGLDHDASDKLRNVADRVSQHLSSGTVVLDYFVTSSSVTVVALAAGQSPIIASNPLFGAALEGFVRRLDSDLARRVRPDQIQGDAARLADIVFPPGPVRDLIASPQTRELVLIPHGVLHEVPFAFLPVSGVPLVIHAIVRSLPFAEAALASRAHPTGAMSAAVFWHLGDDTSVPLLHAKEEAGDIAALYHLRADPAPSRSSVMTALQTTRVVHLIAHGAAAIAATEYSRIDLPARPPSDDGDLAVSDILLTTGNLSSDAVVLSSCEMANSRRTPGDDGAGIARALLQKGVGAVVAPVWQIVDAPQDVLLELHRGLARGEPAATALANAQRHAYLIGKNPAFWAGFVVLGGNP
jgi:CHAT domain-containing protein